LAVAAPLSAQVVASTPRGVVVAHDHVIELPGVWTTDGLQTPEAVVTSKDQIAVLDPLANEARIVELATGRGRTVRTGESPIAGVFVDRALYLLERDARALERIGVDGTRASISTHADPAFLREHNGVLYVYCRSGFLDEVLTSPFVVRRSTKTVAFGSDFEIDGNNGYVLQPRGGTMTVVALDTLTTTATYNIGAVPIDLAITASGSAVTASTIAIADPAMKKVWITEGALSTTQAFLRGFLRGLIGLGLAGGNASQFPTGIDRVIVRGQRWYAYDTSSGTLYRFTQRASSVIAKGIAQQAFAVTNRGVLIWNNEVRALQKPLGDE
jgi:hypothetical protein